jgi:hypothetical protein
MPENYFLSIADSSYACYFFINWLKDVMAELRELLLKNSWLIVSSIVLALFVAKETIDSVRDWLERRPLGARLKWLVRRQ